MASANAGLQEAVPIVGALACGLAERLSIRALLIKGAPATAMGVRSARPSVDVDIWIEPARFDDYLVELAKAGWSKAPEQVDGVGWGHAITMVHPEWASTIDAHRRFPGFLTDDATAFELAWTTRATARIAHQGVAVPSRVVAAAITVLHTARSTSITGSSDDLACALAAARAFTQADRDELCRLVTATSSVEPLAGLLREAECEVPASSAPDAAHLEEWRVRLAVGFGTGSAWLLALRTATWRHRVVLLLGAAKPNAKDYAESGAHRTAGGFVTASIYHWRRGIRSLPGAIRAVRAAIAARTD